MNTPPLILPPPEQKEKKNRKKTEMQATVFVAKHLMSYCHLCAMKFCDTNLHQLQ